MVMVRWGGCDAADRGWGEGQLVMPHSIAVDGASGDVWVTDVALHQVIAARSGRLQYQTLTCAFPVRQWCDGVVGLLHLSLLLQHMRLCLLASCSTPPLQDRLDSFCRRLNSVLKVNIWQASDKGRSLAMMISICACPVRWATPPPPPPLPASCLFVLHRGIVAKAHSHPREDNQRNCAAVSLLVRRGIHLCSSTAVIFCMQCLTR